MVLSIFFFKQKTAYEMRISDWSSDVCSSDLVTVRGYAGNPRDSRVNRPLCRSGRRLFLWQRRAKARKTAVLPEFMKHEVRHGRPLDARKLAQQADPAGPRLCRQGGTAARGKAARELSPAGLRRRGAPPAPAKTDECGFREEGGRT